MSLYLMINTNTTNITIVKSSIEVTLEEVATLTIDSISVEDDVNKIMKALEE